MVRFLFDILKQLLAFGIAFILFCGFVLVALVGVSLLLEETPVEIKGDSILVLDLSDGIADSPPQLDPFQAMVEALRGIQKRPLYLKALVDTIDRAATDDRITGIFIHGSFRTGTYGSHYAMLRELRRALNRFSDQGKPITAYVIRPTLRDYYFVSLADSIILNPFGEIMLKGIAANMVFVGEAFSRYGIGVQPIAAGKFKSVGEMFIRSEMSPENRLQTQVWIDELWHQILDDIGETRSLPRESLIEIAENDPLLDAKSALEYGLVDKLGYFDEVIDDLIEVSEFDVDRESFRQVAMQDYTWEDDLQIDLLDDELPKVAIVYAEGLIVNGEGDYDQVGADKLTREIRKLRRDEDVKAMVLRVNSPGGSALASEVIEREVGLLAKAKPVVVSMGGYAASGGYWISVNADKILAQTVTITGSIGVFGLLPNVKQIANDHGITFDGVKSSPYADLLTLARPKSEDEMGIIIQSVATIYEAFLNKVATGREMSTEQVDLIAQGRVWSGLAALNHGLVDRIGGLHDAIEEAAALAGLGVDYRTVQIPEPLEFRQLISRLLEGEFGRNPLSFWKSSQGLLKRIEDEIFWLGSLDDPGSVYARLPFSIHLN